MMHHTSTRPRSTNRVARAAMLMAAILWLLSTGISPAPTSAQTAPIQKTVSGRVLEDGEKPVTGAIVYLQDGRTNNIRSFVSVDGGTYRFGQLSMETDYQLWAGYKGRKSAVKNVSSFDAKKQLIVDLHLK